MFLSGDYFAFVKVKRDALADRRFLRERVPSRVVFEIKLRERLFRVEAQIGVATQSVPAQQGIGEEEHERSDGAGESYAEKCEQPC